MAGQVVVDKRSVGGTDHDQQLLAEGQNGKGKPKLSDKLKRNLFYDILSNTPSTSSSKGRHNGEPKRRPSSHQSSSRTSSYQQRSSESASRRNRVTVRRCNSAGELEDLREETFEFQKYEGVTMDDYTTESNIRHKVSMRSCNSDGELNNNNIGEFDAVIKDEFFTPPPARRPRGGAPRKGRTSRRESSDRPRIQSAPRGKVGRRGSTRMRTSSSDGELKKQRPPLHQNPKRKPASSSRNLFRKSHSNNGMEENLFDLNQSNHKVPERKQTRQGSLRHSDSDSDLEEADWEDFNHAPFYHKSTAAPKKTRGGLRFLSKLIRSGSGRELKKSNSTGDLDESTREKASALSNQPVAEQGQVSSRGLRGDLRRELRGASPSQCGRRPSSGKSLVSEDSTGSLRKPLSSRSRARDSYSLQSLPPSSEERKPRSSPNLFQQQTFDDDIDPNPPKPASAKFSRSYKNLQLKGSIHGPPTVPKKPHKQDTSSFWKSEARDTSYSYNSGQLTESFHRPEAFVNAAKPKPQEGPSTTRATKVTQSRVSRRSSMGNKKLKSSRAEDRKVEEHLLGLTVDVAIETGKQEEMPDNIDDVWRRIYKVEDQKQAELQRMQQEFEQDKKLMKEHFQKRMQKIQTPKQENVQASNDELKALEDERRELEAMIRDLQGEIETLEVDTEIQKKDNMDQYECFQILRSYVEKETATNQKLVATDKGLEKIYNGSLDLIVAEKNKTRYRDCMYKCSKGVQTSEALDPALLEEVMTMVAEVEAELGCQVHDLDHLEEASHEVEANQVELGAGVYCQPLHAISEETEDELAAIDQSYRITAGEKSNDQFDQIDKEIEDCTQIVSQISSEACEEAQLITLHENKDMLYTIFKLLDKDNSGELDRTEFEVGISLLNRRLPAESQFRDHRILFNLLDADGNGTIDLGEFAEIFSLNTSG